MFFHLGCGVTCMGMNSSHASPQHTFMQTMAPCAAQKSLPCASTSDQRSSAIRVVETETGGGNLSPDPTKEPAASSVFSTSALVPYQKTCQEPAEPDPLPVEFLRGVPSCSDSPRGRPSDLATETPPAESLGEIHPVPLENGSPSRRKKKGKKWKDKNQIFKQAEILRKRKTG